MLKYSYLADGMKAGALNDGGAGLVYRGSLVFRRDSLGVLSFESAPIAAGRITATGVRYHVTDHLGSVRGVVDGTTGNLLEASDYEAFGLRSDAANLPSGLSVSTPSAGEAPCRYHYTGQEDQLTVPYTDFGARHYSPALRCWMVPDPLSEDYYGISPYAFCAGDPINLVDEEGERPRIYIQNGGFGHAFITTGEGVKTTVYSYGRYGALDRYSGKTSGQSTPLGEGVLRILKGKDAATYLNKVFDEGGFSVFECFKGDDALIDAFFEEKFKNGSDPSDPLKETYNNPNSRAINRYSLLFQNCVTTTLSAASIGQCGIFSNAITPLELNNDLRIFNPGSVKVVNNPKVFLLELLQELWDALSN